MTVELDVTDDLTGVSRVDVNLTRPGAGGFYTTAQRVSGDEYAGTYRAVFAVPSGTVKTYDVRVSLFDIRNYRGTFPGLSMPRIAVGTAAAPTAVTATTSGPNRQVTVSWQSSGDDGGNVIEHYYITTDPYVGEGWVAEGASTESATFALENAPADVPLAFKVYAYNAGGVSEWSAPSAAILVPGVAPSAARNVTSTREPGAATVSWEPSLRTGGYPVSYSVRADPGGQTVAVAPEEGTSTRLPGLTDGVAYTFTITASNEAGDAEPVTSTALAPVFLPGAPVDVRIRQRRDDARLTWAAPDTDGGSPLIGYEVTGRHGQGTRILPPYSTSAEFRGLDLGRRYRLSVRAVTAYGASQPSEVVVIPYWRPSKPTIVSVTARGDSAVVRWTKPESNGRRITAYKVNRGFEGDASYRQIGPRTFKTTFRGLESGTHYFRVAAKNAAGWGDFSRTRRVHVR